jgi:hypothetical protein
MASQKLEFLRRTYDLSQYLEGIQREKGDLIKLKQIYVGSKYQPMTPVMVLDNKL